MVFIIFLILKRLRNELFVLFPKVYIYSNYGEIVSEILYN